MAARELAVGRRVTLALPHFRAPRQKQRLIAGYNSLRQLLRARESHNSRPCHPPPGYLFEIRTKKKEKKLALYRVLGGASLAFTIKKVKSEHYVRAFGMTGGRDPQVPAGHLCFI